MFTSSAMFKVPWSKFNETDLTMTSEMLPHRLCPRYDKYRLGGLDISAMILKILKL